MWHGLTRGKGSIKSLHAMPYSHLKTESSHRAQLPCRALGSSLGRRGRKLGQQWGPREATDYRQWDPPTSTYPLWLQIDGKLRLTGKKFTHGLPIKLFEPGKGSIIWLWICSELQTPTYQGWGTFSRSAGVAAMRYNSELKPQMWRNHSLSQKQESLCISTNLFNYQ